MQLTVTIGKPEQFTSDTAEQMVGLLWKTAFLRETSPGEYMAKVAQRVKVWNGSDVRFDTAGHFLADLEAAGMVRIEYGTEER